MTSDGLEAKVKQSQEILREALGRFGDQMALAWTGGKDSTTILHLLRELGGGTVPIPILNIDTGAKFQEIYEFRDRLAQEWRLNLIIARNEAALKTIVIAADREECCTRLKSEVIAQSIRTQGWQALITGMRWDEQPDRRREEYFSPRSSPEHMRIHPILHFSEADIWRYLNTRKAPYCSLYRKGYRSLGCEPCTLRGVAGEAERAGRSPQKEEIMKRLRAMGYF